MIALSSLTRRRRACLDTSQWSEIPWGAQHRQRTLKDKLVDSMIAIAAVLEQLDMCCDGLRLVCQASHASDEVLTTCVSKCITPAQQLRAWEIEALRVSAQARLEDACTRHGFGFFIWPCHARLSCSCSLLAAGQIRIAFASQQRLCRLLPRCFRILNHAPSTFPHTHIITSIPPLALSGHKLRHCRWELRCTSLLRGGSWK